MMLERMLPTRTNRTRDKAWTLQRNRADYEKIRIRTIRLAQLIINNDYTLREAEAATGVPRSTIHQDMTYRLPYINKALALQVAAVLQYNKDMRSKLGGEATAKLYMERRYEKQLQAVLAERKARREAQEVQDV